MKINPETLARASSRHAWRTVAIWAVILVIGFGASGALLSNALTTDFDFTNNPEAIRAQTLLRAEGARAGHHAGDVRDDRCPGRGDTIRRSRRRSTPP